MTQSILVIKANFPYPLASALTSLQGNPETKALSHEPSRDVSFAAAEREPRLLPPACPETRPRAASPPPPPHTQSQGFTPRGRLLPPARQDAAVRSPRKSPGTRRPDDPETGAAAVPSPPGPPPGGTKRVEAAAGGGAAGRPRAPSWPRPPVRRVAGSQGRRSRKLSPRAAGAGRGAETTDDRASPSTRVAAPRRPSTKRPGDSAPPVPSPSPGRRGCAPLSPWCSPRP